MGHQRLIPGLLALIGSAALGFADVRAGEPADVVAVDLPPEIDRVAGIPERFAVEVPHRFGTRTHGQWYSAAATRTWRYTLRVPGAVSLSFHVRPIVLPRGAVLTVSGASDQYRYSDTSVHRGELWSRIARGDTLDFALTVDNSNVDSVTFEVTGVQAGFRSLGGEGPNHPHYDALRLAAQQASSGTSSCVENFQCHVTSGDSGPGQSSVVLVIANLGLCSGVLLNDVPGDGVPYVLTARHCENGSSDGGDPGAASGVTAYFDAVTPCGQTLGSIYTPTTATTAGATTVVEQQDAWLIRLDGPPPVTDAFYSGWDATGSVFIDGYTAHYELGNARQFTGWYGQAYYQTVPGSALGVHYVSTFWDLVNQVGSIGPGASGSGVLDGNNHLVGTIVRGIAQSSQAGSPGVCPVSPLQAPSPQTATGFATALSGIFDSTADPQSTTGAVTLRSVLDPHGSGALVLDGQWQAATFSASSNASTTGSFVTLTWSAPGATTCTASGGQSGDGWSGSLAASGSLPITEYNAGAVTYRIACPTSAGRQSTAQVTVTWSLAPPAATLQATAASSFVGSQIQLLWSATVTPCTATGGAAGDGWAGTLPAHGTQSVTESTAGTFTYGITCGSGSRSASAQTQFTFITPSVTLQDGSVSLVNVGQPITLVGSTNGTSCTTSGGASGDGWAGLNFLALGEIYTLTEQVPGTYTYTLSCGAGAFVVSASVTVTFSNGPPKVALSTTPSAPTVATTFLHVSWVSSVAPCTLAVTGYASYTLSNYGYVAYHDDSENVIGPYTYTVTCGAGSNTATATATVNWVGTPQVRLTPYSSPVVTGQSTSLTWMGNVVPCVASGGSPGDGWSGSSSSAVGFLQVTESQPGTYNYTITCGSGTQVASAQATLSVNSSPVFATLTASATTGALGGPPVTLTWNSNTSPCQPSGGSVTDAWRQSTASSGTASITEVDPGAYTFLISCGSGSTNTASAQVTITFTGPTRPTFTTSTNYATAGQPFLLSWKSSDGSSCTAGMGAAGDGWSGALPPSGTKQIVELLAGPYAYTLKCGVAGVSLLGVEVNPAPPAPQPEPPTSVQISASSTSVFVNQNVSLTWSSTGATACAASGGSGADGWSGTVPPSGAHAIAETTPGSYTYNIGCTGTGTASAQATVVVNPPPSATLSASPTTVAVGQSFSLNWNSSETTGCTAAGGSGTDGWQGSEPVSGTTTLTEGTQGTYTYTLTCTAGSETVQAQAVVLVSAPRSSGGGGALDQLAIAVLGLLLALRCANTPGLKVIGRTSVISSLRARTKISPGDRQRTCGTWR